MEAYIELVVAFEQIGPTEHIEEASAERTTADMGCYQVAGTLADRIVEAGHMWVAGVAR